jgi:hypothetical protein
VLREKTHPEFILARLAACFKAIGEFKRLAQGLTRETSGLGFAEDQIQKARRFEFRWQPSCLKKKASAYHEVRRAREN